MAISLALLLTLHQAYAGIVLQQQSADSSAFFLELEEEPLLVVPWAVDDDTLQVTFSPGGWAQLGQSQAVVSTPGHYASAGADLGFRASEAPALEMMRLSVDCSAGQRVSISPASWDDVPGLGEPFSVSWSDGDMTVSAPLSVVLYQDGEDPMVSLSCEDAPFSFGSALTLSIIWLQEVEL